MKLRVEQLENDLKENAFVSRLGGPEKIGVEVEMLPFETRSYRFGSPRRAVVDATLEFLEGFGSAHNIPLIKPGQSVQSPVNGTLAFEPGGQIEFSSPTRSSPAAIYELVATVVDGIQKTSIQNGVTLRSYGYDPWTKSTDIPLQLDAERYRSFFSLFDSIGPWGRAQAINTTSIQVCLDFGDSEQLPVRWRAAQRVSPIATALFAASPFSRGVPTGHRSFRALQWLNLEPSRCGFPSSKSGDGRRSPAAEYLRFALNARVALIRTEPEWTLPPKALRFQDWIEQGFEHRYPDLDDWHYHLTTLWPEVRPQGYLELRSIDNQCRTFLSVPITFWCALLLDSATAQRCLEIIPDGDLNNLLATGLKSGLADRDHHKYASKLWEIAQDAIGTFPRGYFTPEMIRAFELYGTQFVHRGVTPADEFLRACENGPVQPRHLERRMRAWQALL